MTTIATWNVNGIRARLDHVVSWLDAAAPDLLALQETKVKDDAFPLAPLAAKGYEVAFSGQPSYNGVATLARAPRRIEVVSTALPGFEDEARRVLVTESEGTLLANLYVPNGRAVDTEPYAYKLAWLEALLAYLGELLKAGADRLVVVGDFNIAPADADVHDPERWAGKVLCSERERAALAAVLDLGFVDLFRTFTDTGGHYSWWDYRAGAFRRDHGLRIDLILADAKAAAAAEGCRIDREPRSWEKPSDHTPVIADFRG